MQKRLFALSSNCVNMLKLITSTQAADNGKHNLHFML